MLLCSFVNNIRTYACDQLCQNVHCLYTISMFTFYHHPADTTNSPLAKSAGSAFTEASFFSLSDIHECWLVYKCPILPGYANSQQGVTTQLAGETRHGFSYILWYVRQKMPWSDTIWPYKYFWIRRAHQFVAPHHSYRSACGIATLWNKLYKIVGNSANYSLKNWST